MTRKNITKSILLLVFLLLCTAIVAFYYAQLDLQERNKKTDLFTLIPQDCETVVEVSNLYSLFQTLQYTDYINSHSQLQLSHIIRMLSEKLYILSEKKAHGLSGQSNYLLISSHNPCSPADQVVYGYLGDEDQDFIHSLLSQNVHTKSLQKTVAYNGEELTIYPINNDEFLVCYAKKGFYAISLQKKLIEKVIDTYLKHTPSLREDTLFNRIAPQKVQTNSFNVYTRSLPLAAWTGFEVRIHNDAIYMIGNCWDGSNSDSFAESLSVAKRVNLISDPMLPEGTSMFYQFPLSDGNTLLPVLQMDSLVSSNRYTFADFMEEYTQREVMGIAFEGRDSLKQHHVSLLPMAQPVADWGSKWRGLIQPPTMFKRIGNTYCAIYSLQDTTIVRQLISPYTAHTDSVGSYHATIYNDVLILSKSPDDIVAYLQQLVESPQTDAPFSKERSDLMQSMNFTLLADMEQAKHYPNEFARYFSPFFFKNIEFLKHFTLSLQLIKVADEPLNANIILTYKPKTEVR